MTVFLHEVASDLDGEPECRRLDRHAIASMALMMTGSTPGRREHSIAHFATICETGDLEDALAALAFVAHGRQPLGPGDWWDVDEARVVLAGTLAARVHGVACGG